MDNVYSKYPELKPIADGVLQQFYQEKTVTLAAGQRLEDFTTYSYFRVLALTGTGLEVIFGNNQFQTPFTGAGLGIEFSYVLPRLTLVNTSGAPLTITFAVATGKVNDDRLTVSGVLTVTAPTNAPVAIRNCGALLTQAQVAVGTSAVTISGSSSTKNSVLIKNIGSITVFIGGTGVTTANGMPIEPGEYLAIDVYTGILGICASPGGNVAVLTEFV